MLMLGVLLAVATVAESKSIQIVKPDRYDAVTVEFPQEIAQKSMEEVCEALWALSEKDPHPRVKVIACNLFTDVGIKISGVEDLAENEFYNVVPVGQRFCFPPKEIGHRVTLKGVGYDEDNDIELETVSVEPPIFRLHNFISKNEIDHFVNFANTSNMERSTGGLQTGDSESEVNQGEFTSHRTSSNAWDTHSDISVGVQKRSFDMLRFPKFDVDMSDGLQVVKYVPGQFYHHHTDWFEPNESPGWNWDPSTGGSNRFATVFIYLSETELGGETVFQYAKRGVDENLKGTDEEANEAIEALFPDKSRLERKMAKTCREKFAVTPRKGEAVLFYHQNRAGHLDVMATHGACPVLRGEKWGANLWVWNDESWTLEKENKNLGKPDPTYRAITLDNQLSEPVTVYWKSHTGEHSEVARLQVGETTELNSYVSHVFLVKNQDNPTDTLASVKIVPRQERQWYTFYRGEGNEVGKPEIVDGAKQHDEL